MPGNREFYQNHTSERMFGLGEILYDGTGVSRKFESRIGRRRSKDACESIGSKEPKVVPRRRGAVYLYHLARTPLGSALVATWQSDPRERTPPLAILDPLGLERQSCEHCFSR